MINSGSSSTSYSESSYPYLAVNCGVGSGLLWNENFECTLRATSSVPNQLLSETVGSGSAFNVMQPTLFIGNLFIWNE